VLYLANDARGELGSSYRIWDHRKALSDVDLHRGKPPKERQAPGVQGQQTPLLPTNCEGAGPIARSHFSMQRAWLL